MQLDQLEEWFRRPDKQLERYITLLPENAEERMEALPFLSRVLNRWPEECMPRSVLICTIISIGRILQYASNLDPSESNGDFSTPIKESQNALLRMLEDNDLELVSCAIYAFGLAGKLSLGAFELLIHLSRVHKYHPLMQLRVAQSLYWITDCVPDAVLAQIIEHGLLNDFITKWTQKPKLSGT